MFELSPDIDKNKIFLVDFSEIEGRLDPHFYSPKFQKLISKFSDIKHSNLGALVSFSNETWNQEDFFDNEFPYIEISEIDITSGEIGNIKYVSKSKAPSRAKKIVRQNDIIISTTRPDRGAIALINERYDFHIASTGFSVIRNIKSENITLSYLYFILRQNFTLLQMEQRSSGGNYPAITEDELKKILIPLPPKEIQQQIINLYEKAYNEKQQKEAEAERLLNSIDDYLLDELGIELPQKDNSLENRIFRVNFSEVTGGRFDPFYFQTYYKKLENNIKNNGKFLTKQIKEFIDFIDSGNRPKGGVGNIKDGVFSIGGEHISDFCEVGIGKPKYIPINFHNKNLKTETKLFDIILVKDGATTGKIGIIENKKYINQNINEHVFLIRLKGNTLPFYFTYFLHSKVGKFLLKREITGATVTGLTKESVNKILIPIPPIEKQNEIAKYIKAIREQAKQLKTEAKKILEQAKQEVEKMILGE